MVKSINTLVSDIYKLLDEGKEVSQESLDELGKSVSSMIATRLRRTEPEGRLRMSALGTPCQRKLWYSVNRPGSAEPLAPHTKLNFLVGDLVGLLLPFLSKEAGHTVEGVEDELEIKGVKGHRDAIIDGVLVDFKTANSRSFQKFKNHELDDNDPFGYQTQLNLYLHASQEDPRLKVRGEYAYLAFDKELGHIVLDRYRAKSKTDWPQRVSDAVAGVGRTDPPPRGFSPVPMGKSGNMKLPTQCKYCQYKKECYPGLRTFIYSSGPEFLTTVVDEPRVSEKKSS